MLDVHPPHAATHTWKDFWIHLGTIAAGLLLAISLEQSVEAIHRHHQRHQLERDLHTEAVHNAQIIQHDIQILQDGRDYALALKSNVDALRRGALPSSLHTVRPPQDSTPFLPSEGAWASARDSSELALLPREQTSMFEELYAQHEFLVQALLELSRVQDDVASFCQKAQSTSDMGDIDPARLTPAERDEFAALLGRLAVKSDEPVGNLHFYQAENDAVVKGAETVDQLHQSVITRFGADTPTQPSTMKSESSQGKNP